jgi:hypothetical protein
MNWNEYGKMWPWPSLRQYPATCLERLRQIKAKTAGVTVRGTPHTLPWLALRGLGESLRGGACTVPMLELIKV